MNGREFQVYRVKDGPDGSEFLTSDQPLVTVTMPESLPEAAFPEIRGAAIDLAALVLQSAGQEAGDGLFGKEVSHLIARAPQRPESDLPKGNHFFFNHIREASRIVRQAREALSRA